MNKFNALYVHDHIFVLNEEGIFHSEGKITDSVFSRYSVCAQHIDVFARARKASVSGLDPITSNAVRFHPTEGISFGAIFSRHFFNNLRIAVRLVKRNSFAILRLPSFLGTFCYPLLRLFGRPYFVECVGHPREAIISSGRPNLAKRILASVMEQITKQAVRNAQGVIYVTKNKLQQDFPTTGFTAYASNVELPATVSTPRPLRTSSPIVIGLIGSYRNDYKGIDTAIEAIHTLKQEGIDATLRVLGSGDPTRFILQAQTLEIQDQIFFDGTRQGGEKVYDWLDALDIYIQPSRTEGLPRSLVEAMSRGLACIGSRVGGIPELLPNEWLFPGGDSHQLAEKLKLLVKNPSIRDSAGSTNLTTASDYTTAVLDIRRRNFWLKARDRLVQSRGEPA